MPRSSDACPPRNTSETDVSFVDTGPYTEGVRSATYNCSGAGLVDTFTCNNGSWVPEGFLPCDGTVLKSTRSGGFINASDW